MLAPEEKAARKEERRLTKQLAKENARIDAEKNQKPVKALTISIEWAKSRTWGHNPHAEAQVEFQDGNYERKEGYTASGCGYDKESTVIAAVFNDFLKYKLWNLHITPKHANNGGTLKEVHSNPVPYGVAAYSKDNPHYSGGIGTSCYTAISEFIGGKFEHIASGKSFDVYKYTDGEPTDSCKK